MGKERTRHLGQMASACWIGPGPPRKQVDCSAESQDQDSLSTQLLSVKAEARESFPLLPKHNFHSSYRQVITCLPNNFFFFSPSFLYSFSSQLCPLPHISLPTAPDAPF